MNTPSNAGKEIVHLYPRDENLAIFGCTSLFYEWTLDAWAAWAYESGVAILPHRSMTEALANDPRNPDNSTPPTQSQEGETPETDAFAFRTIPKCGNGVDPDYTQALKDWHEHALGLERRLTAAQRENDRLRSEVAGLYSLIDAQPHHISCRFIYPKYLTSDEKCSGLYNCDCWKSKARAATEEGKQ